MSLEMLNEALVFHPNELGMLSLDMVHTVLYTLKVERLLVKRSEAS